MSVWQLLLGSAALGLVFAIVALFSRALLYQVGETRWAVSLPLATMLLISGSILICRATEDLVIATLIVAAIALVLTALLWNRSPLVPKEDPPPARLRRWALILCAVALFFVSWAAVKNYLWDEFNCHDPVVNVIARGVSPPEHALFPGEPFRYHYGFDVLAALVLAFTRVFVPRAIDVATIACFILLLICAAAMGARLAGRTGANLACAIVPFGTGTLLYLILTELGPTLTVRWSAIPEVWTQSSPPPVISNFFQHPQGLGMAVSLAVLLLFEGNEKDDRRRLGRVAIGSLLLGMLSIAQIVFFGVLGLAIGVSILARAYLRRKEGKRAVIRACIELLLVASSLLVARALGGFFEPVTGSPAMESTLAVGRSFFGEPLLRSLMHHLVLFGLPLILFPLSFWRLLRGPIPLRIALIVAVLVGFIVPNVMTYDLSWDIVKFYGIGAFFANVLLADLLVPWIEDPQRAKRALAIATVVLSTWVGWVWVVRMSLLDGNWTVPKMHFPPPPQISLAVREKLGPLVKPRERVFSTNMDMGIGAGFLTPGFDWRTAGQGYMLDRSRAERYNQLYEDVRRTLRREELAELGVRWLVMSNGDQDGLAPEVRAQLQDPDRFQHVFDVEGGGEVRHVYKIVLVSPERAVKNGG
jgi:hypothetical protein